MQEYIRWLLPLLTFPQVITLLFVTLLISITLGRFILKIFRIDKYLSPHFAVNISIYGAAGFLFSTLILNTIAIFFIGTSSLIIFSIIIALVVFTLARLGEFSTILYKIKNIKRSLRSLSNNLAPLVLISLTLYHYSKAIEIMGWPAVGDILWTHGPFTSLLEYTGKITLSLEPLSSRQITYPIGSHVVAANFASWFNLFPGEAVLLLSGFFAILIVLLIYSLTHILTRSIPLSLLTYSAMFITHPQYWHWDWWLMGYFYGGPYPNLTGLLVIFFSVAILSLEYAPPKKSKKQEQELHVGSIATLFLSFLVSLLVYTPFFIFVAIITLFILSTHFTDIIEFLQKKPALILPPLALGTLFIFIPRFYAYLFSPAAISGIMATKKTYINYLVSPTFLFDHITGYVMCFALPISILLLIRKRYLLLNLFYILVFCIPIYTLSPTAPDILYLILPGRVVMIPWVLSWVIVALGAGEVIRVKGVKKYFNHRLVSISVILAISLIILIPSPRFNPSIIGEFSYSNAKNWGWYTRWETFPNDYVALLWIYYNVPPKDLILIDQSTASNWLLSLSIKNVTYTLHSDSYQKKRLFELDTIWNKPYDNETVYQLLEKYNVSYILITSEPGYYLVQEPTGGILGYVTKPFTPNEYISLFDTYPYLKIVFRLGYTTVYKVNIA